MAAQAALSLPRLQKPAAPGRPSLPSELPSVRPFGSTGSRQFKFASSLDRVPQASPQPATFVRPDVPPMDLATSATQQPLKRPASKHMVQGRSALEQASYVTSRQLYDSHSSKEGLSLPFKLGIFGL